MGPSPFWLKFCFVCCYVLVVLLVEFLDWAKLFGQKKGKRLVRWQQPWRFSTARTTFARFSSPRLRCGLVSFRVARVF